MSIVHQEENMTYHRYLDDFHHQIAMERPLTIPDGYVPIGVILGGGCRVEPIVCTATDDRLTISGRAYPYVMYRGECPKRHHSHHHEDLSEAELDSEEDLNQPNEYGVNWSGPDALYFEEQIPVPGLREGMKVDLDLGVVSSNFEKDGPDRIIFYGKIDAAIHPAAAQSSKIIREVAAQLPSKVTTQTERLLTETLLETRSTNLSLESYLALPKIKPGLSRILQFSAQPTNLTYENARGQIFMRGALELALVYVGCDDDNQPTGIFYNEWTQSAGNAIPFETRLDTEHGVEGLIIVPKVSVADTNIEARSSHELSCKFDLRCEARLSAINENEIISDLSSGTEELIDLEKQFLEAEEYSGEAFGEIEIDLPLELPYGHPAIDRVLLAHGTLKGASTEFVEDKALIEGEMELGLTYISDEPEDSKLEMVNWSNGIQIAGAVPFPGLQPSMLSRTYLNLEDVKVETIDSRNIRLTGLVKARVFARNPRAMLVVSRCAEVTAVDPATRPSMLFYVVQPSDTLWSIARRYNTTLAQLAKTNEILNTVQLTAGQKLVIPKP